MELKLNLSERSWAAIIENYEYALEETQNELDRVGEINEGLISEIAELKRQLAEVKEVKQSIKDIMADIRKG